MTAPFNILTSPSRLSLSRIRVHLTYPGDPLSKARPRFAKNKNGSVYTPRVTQEAENDIAWEIKLAHRALLIDETSTFGVRVTFFCKSRQRRDIDNMTKLVFDACTGLVWADDSQVEELQARLVRADPTPRTELVIYTLGGMVGPATINCRLCHKPFPIYPSWAGRPYCSRTCFALAQRNGIDATCNHCGKDIWRAQNRVKGSRSGLFYCSLACKSLATTDELTCAWCAIVFRRPHSLNRSGRKFCGEACMALYWNADRRSKIKGTCQSCGGGVTRKEYIRCQACRIRQAPLRSPGRRPAETHA